jgi:hypothetical protein
MQKRSTVQVDAKPVNLSLQHGLRLIIPVPLGLRLEAPNGRERLCLLGSYVVEVGLQRAVLLEQGLVHLFDRIFLLKNSAPVMLDLVEVVVPVEA